MVPFDYRKTGEDDTLLQDLVRVQAAIRGSYRRSTKPPPSLNEITTKLSKMPLPTPPNTVVIPSMDDIAPFDWDYRDPDAPSSPRRDDPVRGLQLTGTQPHDDMDNPVVPDTRKKSASTSTLTALNGAQSGVSLDSVSHRPIPPRVNTDLQDPSLTSPPLLSAMSALDLHPLVPPPSSTADVTNTLDVPTQHEDDASTSQLPDNHTEPSQSQETMASTDDRIDQNNSRNEGSATPSALTGMTAIQPLPSISETLEHITVDVDEQDHDDAQQDVYVDPNTPRAATLDVPIVQEDPPPDPVITVPPVSIVEDQPGTAPEAEESKEIEVESSSMTLVHPSNPEENEESVCSLSADSGVSSVLSGPTSSEEAAEGGETEAFPSSQSETAVLPLLAQLPFALAFPVQSSGPDASDPGSNSPNVEGYEDTSQTTAEVPVQHSATSDEPPTPTPPSQTEQIDGPNTSDSLPQVADPATSQREQCEGKDEDRDTSTTAEINVPSTLPGTEETSSNTDSTKPSKDEIVEKPTVDDPGNIGSVYDQSLLSSLPPLPPSPDDIKLELDDPTSLKSSEDTNISHPSPFDGVVASRYAEVDARHSDEADSEQNINYKPDELKASNSVIGDNDQDSENASQNGQDPPSVAQVDVDTQSAFDFLGVDVPTDALATHDAEAAEVPMTFNMADDELIECDTQLFTDTIAEGFVNINSVDLLDFDEDFVDLGTSTPTLSSFTVEQSFSFARHTDTLLIDLGDEKEEEPEPVYPSHALRSLFSLLESVFSMPTPALSVIELEDEDSEDDYSPARPRTPLGGSIEISTTGSETPRPSVCVNLPSPGGDGESTEGEPGVSTGDDAEHQQHPVVDAEHVSKSQTQDTDPILLPQLSRIGFPRLQDEPEISHHPTINGEEHAETTAAVHAVPTPTPRSVVPHPPETSTLFSRDAELNQEKSTRTRENTWRRPVSSRPVEEIGTRTEDVVNEPPVDNQNHSVSDADTIRRLRLRVEELEAELAAVRATTYRRQRASSDPPPFMHRTATAFSGIVPGAPTLPLRSRST